MAPPRAYLVVAFVAYASCFLFACGILLAELTGETGLAAKLANSPFFLLNAALYAMELFVAYFLGWVSWFDRPAKQILRHHGAFVFVAGSFLVMWFMDNATLWQWMITHRALRAWVITAGLTNVNEAFLVFQNFMSAPKAASVRICQPCLALFVMVQAVVIGTPCAIFLLARVMYPEFRDKGTWPVALFAAGVVSQLLAQLSVQVVDSWKVLLKIQRVLSELHQSEGDYQPMSDQCPAARKQTRPGQGIQSVAALGFIATMVVGACLVGASIFSSTGRNKVRTVHANLSGTSNNFGGDRDEHGCIPSAGYQWCPATSECIRPWEKTADFVAKCQGGRSSDHVFKVLGGDRDEHGCIPSAGYQWCPATSECIRPWEKTADFVAKCNDSRETKALPGSRLRGRSEQSNRMYKSKKGRNCQCPPSEAIWSCTMEEYHAIKNGSTCPFYKRSTVHASKKEHTCNCPPAEAEWLCTMDELKAIKNGSTCPFYKSTVQASKKEHTCNCPPAEAEWLCTMDEFKAIKNGSTCPFYKSTVQASKKEHTCNCPPAEAEWLCTMDEFKAIKNGSTCPFYKSTVQESKKDYTCRCPPAEALWSCTMDEYNAIARGDKCPYYRKTKDV